MNLLRVQRNTTLLKGSNHLHKGQQLCYKAGAKGEHLTALAGRVALLGLFVE